MLSVCQSSELRETTWNSLRCLNCMGYYSAVSFLIFHAVSWAWYQLFRMDAMITYFLFWWKIQTADFDHDGTVVSAPSTCVSIVLHHEVLLDVIGCELQGFGSGNRVSQATVQVYWGLGGPQATHLPLGAPAPALRTWIIIIIIIMRNNVVKYQGLQL